MKRYGCFNRAPYAPVIVVREATISKPEISYLHAMAKDCQFSLSELGKTDGKCAGCKWKAQA